MQLNKAFQAFSTYCDSPYFTLPKRELLYAPDRMCTFSGQGQNMVEGLVVVSKNFKPVFDSFIPLPWQIYYAESNFETLKADYLSTPEAQAKLLEMQENPQKRGYFYTERNFSKGLVADSFHFLFIKKRTEAPRLAAFGSGLYGMKKVVKKCILLDLSDQYNATFIDFDFSGAHANIATRLLPLGSSLLKECVESPTFWNDRVQFYLPKMQGSSIPFNQNQCRSCLKVMLYTSLNGGNPYSPARVLDNLSNEMPLLKEKVATQGVSFESTQFYKDFITIFQGDPLIEEVRELNKVCVDQWGTSVHTIDRTEPYRIGSKHLLKGTSIFRGCFASHFGSRLFKTRAIAY